MPNNGHITWTTEKRKISKLTPAPHNPRELTEIQAKNLSTSLERFNLADPIVINTNNRIIGGHQRINILKQSGDLTVDVRVPSRRLTEHEEKELNLRLNKNLGQWDFDALANFDEELLKDVGFESKELDKIFQLDTPEADEIPQVRPETGIKRGDLYALGQHMLLCGDATQKGDVERLMAGEKADMVFTDPPYGVSYKTIRKSGIEAIKNDDLRGNELEGFIEKWYRLLGCEGDKFVFCDWKTLRNFQNVIEKCGDNIGTVIVWNKEFSSHNFIHWIPVYELIIFVGEQKKRDNRCEYNLWTFPREFSKEHSTPKPVALCEKAINRQSERENIVIDLFGGSGSTLIACEKLNRKCRMMEIDPIYCQVIIDRWGKFTGKTVVKVENSIKNV